MKKVVYKGFSYFNFIWMWVLKLIIAIGIFLSVSHFNENPVVVTIVVVLCILGVLFIGDDQVTVYADRVTQSTNSIAAWLFNFKKEEYRFADISKAYLRPEPSAAEVGIATALLFLLPKSSSDQQDEGNPIFLDLKNGKQVTLVTSLEYHKMKLVVDNINALLH